MENPYESPKAASDAVGDDQEFGVPEIRIYVGFHLCVVLLCVFAAWADGQASTFPSILVRASQLACSSVILCMLVSLALMTISLVKLRFTAVIMSLTDCGLTFVQFLAVLPLVQ